MINFTDQKNMTFVWQDGAFVFLWPIGEISSVAQTKNQHFPLRLVAVAEVSVRDRSLCVYDDAGRAVSSDRLRMADLLVGDETVYSCSESEISLLVL